MIGDWEAVADLLRGRRSGRGRAGVVAYGECWIFQGATNPDGYGCINRQDFRGGVHRYVWIKLVGPISDGLQVLHYCDTPGCVRIEHLWLGTQADNIRDMFAKGRGNTSGLWKGSPDAGRLLRSRR